MVVASLRYRAGFTLIEMSIVLVLLGLLAGGVLAGQTLLKSYRLKGVLEEKEQYVAAVNLFSQKYNAFPGDFAGAAQLWELNSGCGGASALEIASCDGDNDGYIDANEFSYVWNHLGQAGLADQTYAISFPADTSLLSNYLLANGTMPESPIRGAGWVIRYVGLVGDMQNIGYFQGAYGHSLHLMRPDSDDVVAAITPVDAQAMDDKMDDGLPARGVFVVLQGSGLGASWELSNPDCTVKANGTTPTDDTDLDATYDAIGTDGNAIACTPIFRNVF